MSLVPEHAISNADFGSSPRWVVRLMRSPFDQWAHLSRRGETCRIRTLHPHEEKWIVTTYDFPLDDETLEAIITLLSLQDVVDRTGLPAIDTPISDVSKWRQIFRQLDAAGAIPPEDPPLVAVAPGPDDKPDFVRKPIPATSMRAFYRIVRHLITSQESRLAVAKELARVPQQTKQLAAMFSRSVQHFARYEN